MASHFLPASRIVAGSSQFIKPPEYDPTYGTAGFRTKGSLLASTLFRCGLLAALRTLQTGKTTGIMVTASHNPEQDNGVKIVEPSGEMLLPHWEAYATTLAAADSDEDVVAALNDIIDRESIGAPNTGDMVVMIGSDTRPSSDVLVTAATAGVELTGVQVVSIGHCTTPILHYCVRARNLLEPCTEEAYIEDLLSGFDALIRGVSTKSDEVLHVDCANGVGKLIMGRLLEPLSARGVNLKLYNTGSENLNNGCGSDHVQKTRWLPAEFSPVMAPACRCCSLDGDGDRIVFFTSSSQPVPEFLLLDGDRISLLACIFITDTLNLIPSLRQQMKIGMVQTAYANGASTRYYREKLGIEVCMAKTGVKHLHHMAKEFDVGIYFEANGHGTVLFSQALLDALDDCDDCQAVRDLRALPKVINQAVGDSVSGILMVEAILRRKEWTYLDWAQLYDDLPSRQSTMLVKDRTVVTTSNAETCVVTPAGLQGAIDKVVSKYPSGRSFVRASGTEDLVRVYAEAATVKDCDSLSLEILRLVHEFADGHGEAPNSV